MKKLLALLVVAGLVTMITGCPPATTPNKTTPKVEKDKPKDKPVEPTKDKPKDPTKDKPVEPTKDKPKDPSKDKPK